MSSIFDDDEDEIKVNKLIDGFITPEQNQALALDESTILYPMINPETMGTGFAIINEEILKVDYFNLEEVFSDPNILFAMAQPQIMEHLEHLTHCGFQFNHDPYQFKGENGDISGSTYLGTHMILTRFQFGVITKRKNKQN